MSEQTTARHHSYESAAPQRTVDEGVAALVNLLRAELDELDNTFDTLAARLELVTEPEQAAPGVAALAGVDTARPTAPLIGELRDRIDKVRRLGQRAQSLRDRIAL